MMLGKVQHVCVCVCVYGYCHSAIPSYREYAVSRLSLMYRDVAYVVTMHVCTMRIVSICISTVNTIRTGSQ